MKSRLFSTVALIVMILAGVSVSRGGDSTGFIPLFPKDGVPEGWVVRRWDDVSKPAETNAVWKVENGVLHGSNPRGTWLMSEKEYGDFVLEFEFKLGETGNSGCALRAPMRGDPAFDGMELQMADFRYNTSAKDSELTPADSIARSRRASSYTNQPSGTAITLNSRVRTSS